MYFDFEFIFRLTSCFKCFFRTKSTKCKWNCVATNNRSTNIVTGKTLWKIIVYTVFSLSLKGNKLFQTVTLNTLVTATNLCNLSCCVASFGNWWVWLPQWHQNFQNTLLQYFLPSRLQEVGSCFQLVSQEIKTVCL